MSVPSAVWPTNRAARLSLEDVQTGGIKAAHTRRDWTILTIDAKATPEVSETFANATRAHACAPRTRPASSLCNIGSSACSSLSPRLAACLNIRTWRLSVRSRSASCRRTRNDRAMRLVGPPAYSSTDSRGPRAFVLIGVAGVFGDARRCPSRSRRVSSGGTVRPADPVKFP